MIHIKFRRTIEGDESTGYLIDIIPGTYAVVAPKNGEPFAVVPVTLVRLDSTSYHKEEQPVVSSLREINKHLKREENRPQ